LGVRDPKNFNEIFWRGARAVVENPALDGNRSAWRADVPQKGTQGSASPPKAVPHLSQTRRLCRTGGTPAALMQQGMTENPCLYDEKIFDICSMECEVEEALYRVYRKSREKDSRT